MSPSTLFACLPTLLENVVFPAAAAKCQSKTACAFLLSSKNCLHLEVAMQLRLVFLEDFSTTLIDDVDAGA